MADIIKPNRTNRVKKKLRLLHLRELIYIIILLGCAALALWKHFWYPLIGCAVMVVLLITAIKRAGPLKGGYAGEKNTLAELKKLPDNYIVISDLLIERMDKKVQTDFLVVSDSSVFIIESKNYSGIVSGNDKSNSFTQTQQLNNGKEHTKTVKNSNLQVIQQSEMIKAILSDSKISAYVIPVLYFSNPSAQIEVTSDLVKIVVSSSDPLDNNLISTITSYPNADDSDPALKHQIANAIMAKQCNK